MKFFMQIIIFVYFINISVLLAGPAKKVNNDNMRQFTLPSCPPNFYTKDCRMECYNDSDCYKKNSGKCVIYSKKKT